MYTLLEQHKLHVPRQLPAGPLLGASLLTRLDRSIVFRGHAIKYVLRGTEHYHVNGRPFAVKADQYLVANPISEGRIDLESANPVAGLCADLPRAFVDGMVTACTRPDELERTSLDHFFNSHEFPENRYDAARTNTGLLMRDLARRIHDTPHHPWRIPLDVYLQLAEAYVADHRQLVPLLHRVKAARTSTRKEIFRGLERARQLMHEHLAEPLDVDAMARAAGMSTFHFFRAFRSVHGTTPHRYRIDLRLEKAAELLRTGKLHAMEAALHCGFPDLPSFSKAFKKRFGVPPSMMRS